uniref:Kinesin motor domain-containing protein n=1 Tax=Mesocestoides corti TaxID=53468 RepID=A0A5K3ETU8_MESCO
CSLEYALSLRSHYWLAASSRTLGSGSSPPLLLQGKQTHSDLACRPDCNITGTCLILTKCTNSTPLKPSISTIKSVRFLPLPTIYRQAMSQDAE